MNKKSLPIYVVKTTRLNEYLIQQGFKMLRPRVDKFNEKFIVFLYEDSKELRDCIARYPSYKK